MVANLRRVSLLDLCNSAYTLRNCIKLSAYSGLWNSRSLCCRYSGDNIYQYPYICLSNLLLYHGQVPIMIHILTGIDSSTGINTFVSTLNV